MIYQHGCDESKERFILDMLALEQQNKAQWDQQLDSNEPIDMYSVGSFGVAQALLLNGDRMPFDDWLVQVGEQWTRMDQVSQYRDEFLIRLEGISEDERTLLMTEEECAAYDELPDTLILHRGCYAHNRFGLSWSLSYDVASRFPFLMRYRHSSSAPLLLTIENVTKDMGFLKLDRGEQEFVLLVDIEDYIGIGRNHVWLDEQELESKAI